MEFYVVLRTAYFFFSGMLLGLVIIVLVKQAKHAKQRREYKKRAGQVVWVGRLSKPK